MPDYAPTKPHAGWCRVLQAHSEDECSSWGYPNRSGRRYQVWPDNGKFYMQETTRGVGSQHSHRYLVFTEDRPGVDPYDRPGFNACAYIEPCGAIPDGLYVSVYEIEALLRDGVITPHERDEEYEANGVGFDPVGEGDSPEEDRNVEILMRHAR